MYIKQNERPFWDKLVNAALDEILATGTPPSQAGLTYALSRLVWGIFGRYPSWTVGVGLRAALNEAADEFKRRKLDPFTDEAGIVVNGDLPEGSLNGVFPYPAVAGTVSNSVSSAVNNIQDLPAGCALVTLDEIEKCLNAGLPLSSLLPTAPKAPVVSNIQVAPGCEQIQQTATKPLEVTEPVSEAHEEARLIRLIKALGIAKKHKASLDSVNKLDALLQAQYQTLLKLYTQ